MSGEDIRKIPAVNAFLLDGSIMDHLWAIQKKFGLPEDRATEYLMLARAVLDGQITMAQMPALIAQAFGVSEEVAAKVACDVVGYRLLPLEEFFPGVAAQIGAWGGKVEDYPSVRVGKKKLSAEEFATELTNEFAFDFSEVIIKRLAFLLKAYLDGEKTRESTLTFFARPVTIGGLGLAPDVAGKLMESVERQREGLAVGVEKRDSGTGAQRDSSADVETARGDVSGIDLEIAEVTTAIEIAPSHELAAEIPVISKPRIFPIPPVIPMVEAKLRLQAEMKQHVEKAEEIRMTGGGQADEAVRAAVDAVLVITAPTLAKVRLSKKNFADITRTVLKGVRDIHGAREMLGGQYRVAGEDLEILVGAIEGSLASQDRTETQVARGPSPSLRMETDNDAMGLSRRFASMTQTMPAEHMESILPGARVSLARSSSEEELEVQAQAVSPEKIMAAEVAAKPEVAKATLTVGSLPPLTQGGQATLTDVRPAQRLIGPVEELGGMTPADFRRLAPSPTEAVLKVEDILSAIEKNSYEERVKGVQAWRQSPICQLYTAMATEALNSGLALAEIAGQRRNKGEESLSPAEIRAIASLNSRIRF